MMIDIKAFKLNRLESLAQKGADQQRVFNAAQRALRETKAQLLAMGYKGEALSVEGATYTYRKAGKIQGRVNIEQCVNATALARAINGTSVPLTSFVDDIVAAAQRDGGLTRADVGEVLAMVIQEYQSVVTGLIRAMKGNVPRAAKTERRASITITVS